MRVQMGVLFGLVLLTLGCNLASFAVVTTTTPVPTITPEPTAVPVATQTPEPEALSLTCDQIIGAALARVGSFCDGTDRNEACYGSDQVSAELLPSAQTSFEQVGDLTSLYNLRRISTASWDDDLQKWGLALLKAQVNLPANLPGQNVTFLLYGGATLDGVTPRMEAVILNTGFGGTTCADAPPSAALVQAPLGSVVSLNINGADLIIGSTLYITAEPDAEMSIGTIDGTVIVTAMGKSEIVAPGAQVKLPLGDEDGLMVVGPPSPPEPFNLQFVELSPLQLLPDVVEIPDPIIPQPTVEASATPTATATATATYTPTRRPITPFPPCFPRTDWMYRYTVARGDTLSSIAQRAEVSVALLQAGNCITNANRIFAGQVLRVPNPVYPIITPVVTDEVTEEPDPIPTEEPDPIPTEEPDPIPTEEPDPIPTEEPAPIPTEEPDIDVTFEVPGCTGFCEGPGFIAQ